MKVHFFKKDSFYFNAGAVVSKKETVRNNYTSASVLFESFCDVSDKQNCGFTCLKLCREVCKYTDVPVSYETDHKAIPYEESQAVGGKGVERSRGQVDRK